MTADISNLYKSKVAVITGGSRGIGFYVSSALVDRGIKVVIGSRNDEQGQKVAKEFNERYINVQRIYDLINVILRNI